MRRSMLFIPGNTPNLLMNGDVLGADSIILDLEDAVSPAEKDSARILVRNALKICTIRAAKLSSASTRSRPTTGPTTSTRSSRSNRT